jgi:hypothetical protein
MSWVFSDINESFLLPVIGSNMQAKTLSGSTTDWKLILWAPLWPLSKGPTFLLNMPSIKHHTLGSYYISHQILHRHTWHSMPFSCNRSADCPKINVTENSVLHRPPVGFPVRFGTSYSTTRIPFLSEFGVVLKTEQVTLGNGSCLELHHGCHCWRE